MLCFFHKNSSLFLHSIHNNVPMFIIWAFSIICGVYVNIFNLCFQLVFMLASHFSYCAILLIEQLKRMPIWLSEFKKKSLFCKKKKWGEGNNKHFWKFISPQFCNSPINYCISIEVVSRIYITHTSQPFIPGLFLLRKGTDYGCIVRAIQFYTIQIKSRIPISF